MSCIVLYRFDAQKIVKKTTYEEGMANLLKLLLVF